MPAGATGKLAFYCYDPQASDEANLRSLRQNLRFVERVTRLGLSDLRLAVERTEAWPRGLPSDHPQHVMLTASIKAAALKAALAAWLERSVAYALRGLNDRPAVDPERYLDETMAMIAGFAEILRRELRAAGAAKRMAGHRPRTAI